MFPDVPPDPVRASKTRAPRERPETLVRPRLLDAMDAAVAAPVTLVSGVAGAGKTTLVGQWAARLGPDRPVAWLTLDARDSDPRRFWISVAAAVRSAGADRPWRPHDPVSDDDLEELAQQLGAQRLVLVLDDLHLAAGDDVANALDRLADALAAPARLVLVSRTRPQLRLARRAAGGGLVEIDGGDLLLTAEETRAVLAAAAPEDAGWTSPETVELVQRATAGWPVAVGLIVQLAGRRGTAPSGLVPVARRHVADYLTEEVLQAQPPDVQDFLLDTCVLDEVTVAAANVVRDRADSGRFLDQLDRDGFVDVVGTGAGADTYRYQGLVRDQLRTHLQATDPARWTVLHRRAAKLLAASDIGRAVQHALSAGDGELAADILDHRLRTGPHDADDLAGALEWVQALPDAALSDRPTLRAFGVGLASRAGRPALARRWAETLAGHPPGGAEDLVTASWLAMADGDIPLLRELCRRGLDTTAEGSPWRRDLRSNLAVAEAASGDAAATRETLRVLVRPASTSGAGSEAGRAEQELVRAGLVLACVRLGQLEEATAWLSGLDGYAARAGAGGDPGSSVRGWAAAMLAHAVGNRVAATAWARSAPHLTVPGHPPLDVLALLDRAALLLAAGDAEGADADSTARTMLGRAAAMIAGFAAPAGLAERLAVEQRAAERAVTGRPGPVQSSAPPSPAAARRPSRLPDGTLAEPLSDREIEVLELLRSEFTLPEIAARLDVSYNTAKTHTKAIYRKLGATARSDAVARARDLGYL